MTGSRAAALAVAPTAVTAVVDDVPRSAPMMTRAASGIACWFPGATRATRDDSSPNDPGCGVRRAQGGADSFEGVRWLAGNTGKTGLDRQAIGTDLQVGRFPD